MQSRLKIYLIAVWIILKICKSRGDVIAEHDIVIELKEIFSSNIDKRILVLGATCVGKTTLLKHFPECHDMDTLVWGLLPKEKQEKLSCPNWTDEMSKIWREYVIKAKQIIKIEAGYPLFAATSFDSDIIVYLSIDEDTLRERTRNRNIDYTVAAENDERIKKEIELSNLPVIVIDMTKRSDDHAWTI